MLNNSVVFWFVDVLENLLQKKNTRYSIKGLKVGFILFIVSEAIYLQVFLQHIFIWDKSSNGNRTRFPSPQILLYHLLEFLY